MKAWATAFVVGTVIELYIISDGSGSHANAVAQGTRSITSAILFSLIIGSLLSACVALARPVNPDESNNPFLLTLTCVFLVGHPAQTLAQRVWVCSWPDSVYPAI